MKGFRHDSTKSIPEIIARLDWFSRNPVVFAEDILGMALESCQIEVLEALGKHGKVAWRSGHGIGKTACAAIASLWFLFSHPDSKVITTASVWRQVSKALWPEIHKWRRGAKLEKAGFVWEYEALATMLRIREEWFATGEASDKAENMEGFHAPALLYVIDEAKAVPDPTWDAIEGSLTGKAAKVLAISTPGNASGRFYDIHARGPKGWKLFHTSCLDSQRPGMQKWVREHKVQWGESSPVYQARVLGEFPEVGPDTLIPLSFIEQAVDRELEAEEPVELGADIARYGDSKTVSVVRAGPKIIALRSYSKEDVMKTTGRIVAAIKEFQPSVVRVDEIGIGAGVVSRLEELGHSQVVGINVGRAASDKEHFQNLRAEIFWALRERFALGEMDIPDNDDLVGQLSALRYSYTSRGQIKIESKEDMRKRGLVSPDCADAVALAFAPTMEPAHLPEAQAQPRIPSKWAGRGRYTVGRRWGKKR